MDTISAVICTHNRVAYLRKALCSLAAQTLAPNRFEVLVIDNASTDQTRATVEDFRRRHPGLDLRYIAEPLLGLSHARNTGIREAKGTYIAYLDDDAIAEPGWLEQITRVFQTVTPRPGAVGGKITPIWEAALPKWLHVSQLGIFSITDIYNSPCFLLEKNNLIGANIAFPAWLLREIGGFPTDMGRKGEKLLGNEEIILLRSIRSKGYGIYYAPEICVAHHIAKERTTIRWVLSRYYWQGVSDALICDDFPEGLNYREFLKGIYYLSETVRHTVLLHRQRAMRELCSLVHQMGKFLTLRKR